MILHDHTFARALPRTKQLAQLLGISLAALLAGCAVGPDYVPPNTQLQPFQHVPASQNGTAQRSAPPLDAW
ncbi:MAG TPA: TolC family protein, partial [Paraburkholderia sp.]|nr:TolC family protein [Paraburkholderia sp.]